jgi:hypothetical protein
MAFGDVTLELNGWLLGYEESGGGVRHVGPFATEEDLDYASRRLLQDYTGLSGGGLVKMEKVGLFTITETT